MVDVQNVCAFYHSPWQIWETSGDDPTKLMMRELNWERSTTGKYDSTLWNRRARSFQYSV